MRKFIYLLLLGSSLFLGCTDGDDVDDIVPIQPDIDTLSLGVYVQENQWIYKEMNHHYLWREDLPDSAKCNYLLDPVSFFKSLLSPKDRFSYCEHNEYYRPETRTKNSQYGPNTVLCDSIYEEGEHRIGYLCYGSFDTTNDLEPVLKAFYESQITDLVLDLRYNGGGLISTCQYLCSSIVPEEAYGRQMQYLKYNSVVTGEPVRYGLSAVTSYNFKRASNGQATIGQQIYGLNLKRIVVLVSRQTASASESSIICLKPYMDVITIGERTTGKGVGMETLYNEKCKYKLVPITFQYYNSQDETVPEDGIEPDITVPDVYQIDYSQIGERDEPLLNLPLQEIITK